MYFFFSIFFQLNCIIRNTKKEKRPQFIYFHLHVMIRILKNAACLWKWEIIQRELDELNNQMSQHPLSSLFVLVVHAVLAKSSVLYAMGIFLMYVIICLNSLNSFTLRMLGPPTIRLYPGSWPLNRCPHPICSLIQTGVLFSLRAVLTGGTNNRPIRAS